MKAQVLYDLREKYEFCSGNDLHQFFEEHVGDPSPSGKFDVRDSSAIEFIHICCFAIERNSGIDMNDCRKALLKWSRRRPWKVPPPTL